MKAQLLRSMITCSPDFECLLFLCDALQGSFTDTSLTMVLVFQLQVRDSRVRSGVFQSLGVRSKL